MSVKFEKDTVTQTGAIGQESLTQTLKDGATTLRDGTHDGKHNIVHSAGVVLTGGKQNEGTKGYLAVRRRLVAGLGQELTQMT